MVSLCLLSEIEVIVANKIYTENEGKSLQEIAELLASLRDTFVEVSLSLHDSLALIEAEKQKLAQQLTQIVLAKFHDK